MMGTNLFMFWWGIKLVSTTWHQIDRRFPLVLGRRRPTCRCRSAALITALFVIERLWTSKLFEEPADDAISQISTE